MNKHKFNSIAHGHLAYCSPINDEMIDEVSYLMQLEPGMSIADIGCAKAEILMRMADLCQVRAFGIDTNERYLHEAQEAIAQRMPAADITLLQQDALHHGYETESFDAVMCVNSTELYGTYDKAVMEIAKLTKAGGMVLMGDYYWRNQSKSELTDEFNVTKDYRDAIEVGLQEGLTPLFASISTQVDLDRYIWSQSYAVEMYAVEHPEDDDNAQLLHRVRTMRNLYVEYGHETLGFGLFLFRKPER